MKKKSKFTIGSVFLVPLPAGRFAVCVLIRACGKGSAYGAFFGPRVVGGHEVEIAQLKLQAASLRCSFGDYGIRTNRWELIGEIPNWDIKQWPLPKFWRKHDNELLCYVTEYDDNLNLLSETIVPVDEVKNQDLVYDSQLGSGVVEIKLDKLLL